MQDTRRNAFVLLYPCFSFPSLHVGKQTNRGGLMDVVAKSLGLFCLEKALGTFPMHPSAWGNGDGSSERGPVTGWGSSHRREDLCFPVRVAQRWAQVAQGGCGICSRGDIKMQLGMALSNLLGCPCPGRAGADAPQPSTSGSLLLLLRCLAAQR